MSTYGIWLAATGMKINEHKQALLTNNLANVNTTGFKHDLAVIRERQVESRSSSKGFSFSQPVLDGLAGGINVRPVHHDLTQGPIEPTDRPLDVAIQGEGFFTVSNGPETRYTRDGSFSLNPEGELVLTAGDGRWRVLNNQGTPIRLDPAGAPLSVSASGIVRQGTTEAGRLGIADSPDRGSLRKVGETLFEDAGGVMQPFSGRLVPEALEGSNFDVMSGLASMIEVARAYEMNASLLRMQDEATGAVVNTVGRMA